MGFGRVTSTPLSTTRSDASMPMIVAITFLANCVSIRRRSASARFWLFSFLTWVAACLSMAHLMWCRSGTTSILAPHSQTANFNFFSRRNLMWLIFDLTFLVNWTLPNCEQNFAVVGACFVWGVKKSCLSFSVILSFLWFWNCVFGHCVWVQFCIVLNGRCLSLVHPCWLLVQMSCTACASMLTGCAYGGDFRVADPREVALEKVFLHQRNYWSLRNLVNSNFSKSFFWHICSFWWLMPTTNVYLGLRKGKFRKIELQVTSLRVLVADGP